MYKTLQQNLYTHTQDLLLCGINNYNCALYVKVVDAYCELLCTFYDFVIRYTIRIYSHNNSCCYWRLTGTRNPIKPDALVNLHKMQLLVHLTKLRVPATLLVPVLERLSIRRCPRALRSWWSNGKIILKWNRIWPAHKLIVRLNRFYRRHFITSKSQAKLNGLRNDCECHLSFIYYYPGNKTLLCLSKYTDNSSRVRKSPYWKKINK